jgi:hypothetical protein
MNPSRDYRKYTDFALDAFIKRFPSHPDHAGALSESERRRKERDQGREATKNQPGAGALPAGKGIPASARVAGIVASIVFALAALYLALQIFSLGTRRDEPPTPLPASSPKAQAPVSGSLPSPEVRHLSSTRENSRRDSILSSSCAR